MWVSRKRKLRNKTERTNILETPNGFSKTLYFTPRWMIIRRRSRIKWSGDGNSGCGGDAVVEKRKKRNKASKIPWAPLFVRLIKIARVFQYLDVKNLLCFIHFQNNIIEVMKPLEKKIIMRHSHKIVIQKINT